MACACLLGISADSLSAGLNLENFELAKELQAIEARLEPWQKVTENNRYTLIQKLKAWVAEYSAQEADSFGSSFKLEGKTQKEVLAKRFEMFIRWVQKRDPVLKQHLKILYAEASALQDRPLSNHELNLVARMQARILSWILVEDLRPYREALSDRFLSDKQGIEELFKMKAAADAVSSRRPWRWSFIADWQSFESLSSFDSSYMSLESLAQKAGAELEIHFLREKLGAIDLATTQELKHLVREDLEKNSTEQTVGGEFLDEVIDYLLAARVSSLKEFKNPTVKRQTKTPFSRIFLDRPGERAFIFSAYRKALRTLVAKKAKAQTCESFLQNVTHSRLGSHTNSVKTTGSFFER
jgi:hypothetical protein